MYASPLDSVQPDLETFLFGKLPKRIGLESQHPATSLYRWGMLQRPVIGYHAGYDLWLEDRIRGAYEDTATGKVLIPLDPRIIDERGLLAAVRSVEVLPAKDARIKAPKPRLGP